MQLVTARGGSRQVSTKSWHFQNVVCLFTLTKSDTDKLEFRYKINPKISFSLFSRHFEKLLSHANFLIYILSH